MDIFFLKKEMEVDKSLNIALMQEDWWIWTLVLKMHHLMYQRPNITVFEMKNCVLEIKYYFYSPSTLHNE